VDQVDIDVIGAEVPQALFERRKDARSAAVAAIGRLRIADAGLGDETHVAPAIAERAGERLLGDAHPIGLGGVEAVDTRIEGALHGTIELRRVDCAVGAGDLPAAEADGGDLPMGATELPVFHRVSSHTHQ
jgi:hypothetical protein